MKTNTAERDEIRSATQRRNNRIEPSDERRTGDELTTGRGHSKHDERPAERIDRKATKQGEAAS